MNKLLTTITILLIATAGYAQIYTVERVVDGNTLKLTNGERVRLIGIDTPESRDNPKARSDAKRTGQDLATINKMGQEATEFLKKLIVLDHEVLLEFDVQERDKYGRILAYVYLNTLMWDKTLASYHYGTDGRLFLNAAIIGAGYATPMTIPPNVKYADLFKELNREAVLNERGLWKEGINSEMCEDLDGVWNKWGLLNRYDCNLKTTDFGKECSNHSQCQSVCVAEDNVRRNKKTKGECWEYTITRGTCLNYVQNGKTTGVICSD